MSPSNMIRVIVATCFVVFITLRPASHAYYAANVSLQLRQRPRTGKCAISASVGNARLGSCSKPPEAGRKANTNLARWDSLQSRFYERLFRALRRVTGRYGVHIKARPI